MSGWTRAEFLRASAATLCLAPHLSWAAEARSTVADAIVVGAGLSGLNAARELVRQGMSSVWVLEARDRVGGRTVNVAFRDGHLADGGGAWAGPQQTRVLALADELGVGTYPSYYDGDTTYDILGRVSQGLLPASTMRERYDALRLLWRLDRMAASFPRGAAWEAPDASALDALTLDDWLVQQQATPFSHAVFKLITRAIMAGYPNRISLLWVLHYASSAGGVLPLILNDGGAQDLRFEGGSQSLSLKMQAALGERVLLDHPVHRIVDVPGEPVAVHTPHGVLRARHVVVAMMPADTMRIRFEPELPPQRLALARGWARLTRLPIIKANVAYDRPFWREAGLNGAMQSDAGPLQLVFDTSAADGSLGVLTCFLSIAEAKQLADARQRQARIVEELVRYFGPKASTPVDYVEKDWSTDPWSTGCITPLTPGLLSATGEALRAPVGRVHWAGTESAIAWCGFMEGAVGAGARAATEVLARS